MNCLHGGFCAGRFFETDINWEVNSESKEKKNFRMDVCNSGDAHDCYIQLCANDSIIYTVFKKGQRYEYDLCGA